MSPVSGIWYIPNQLHSINLMHASTFSKVSVIQYPDQSRFALATAREARVVDFTGQESVPYTMNSICCREHHHRFLHTIPAQ